jgi:uncharacterized protein (TIGR00369 family)
MNQDDLDAHIRSGKALFESMGNFHVVSYDAETQSAQTGFTVRREYCHTNGTIAQGGFVTAWLDASMAQAALRATDHACSVASLEIKVSFMERVGPGEGRAVGRVVRLGKRVAFLEGELYNPEGKLAARATSTAMLVPYQKG